MKHLKLVSALLLLSITGCSAQPLEPNVTIKSIGDPEHDTLMVWGQVNQWESEVLDALLTMPEPDDYHLEVHAFEMTPGQFREMVKVIIKRDELPIIVKDGIGHSELHRLGHIYPANLCFKDYPELKEMPPLILEQLTKGQDLRGFPYEINGTGLFFNKNILRQLGWTDNEIDRLPEQIQAGEWTVHTMFDTAEQAVKLGLVSEGFGLWQDRADEETFHYFYHAHGASFFGEPRSRTIISRSAAVGAFELMFEMQKRKISHPLWIDSDVNNWSSRLNWFDTIGTGQVLFWIGDPIMWPRMDEFIFHDYRAERPLDEIVGFAPFPAAIQDGTPHLSAFGRDFTIIMNPDREPHLVEKACELLTYVISVEYQSRVVDQNRSLSIVPLPEEKVDDLPEFAQQLDSYRDNMIYRKRIAPDYYYFTEIVEPILKPILSDVSHQKISPQDATERLIIELKKTFPDLMVVE